MKSFMAKVFSRFSPQPALEGNKSELLKLFPKGINIESKESLSRVADVLERQVGNRSVEPLLIPKVMCKHGYFQAIVRRPVSLKNTSINSGMLRLTCPHLVKLIDEIEAQGGVEDFNVRISDQARVRKNFAHVNDQWRLIKRASINEEEKEYIENKLHDKAEDFLNSGIIGIRSSGTSDVKCLHAHVADELIRDDNSVGKLVLDDIVAAGHQPSGCDNCWQQCSNGVDKDNAAWWYESVKNKSKLRKKRINRNLYPKKKVKNHDDFKMKQDNQDQTSKVV